MITVPGIGSFHGTNATIKVVFVDNPEPLITQKLSIQAIPELNTREQIRAATELNSEEFTTQMEAALAQTTRQYSEPCLRPRDKAGMMDCLASVALIAERSLGFPVRCSQYRLETKTETDIRRTD